ncbi:glutamine-hydrolyzing GMP synthase [Candidatus Woesearchaeota archaeon]|nr:glutamine-hydrolyzing GMP synthase [Candidatus Woesearchaeota archaeon]
MIVILNFGGQTCHLIAKRVRSFGVYAEILPSDAALEKITEKKPCGIIMSGGPSSVYLPDAPLPDDGIFGLDIPILGICYGHQLIGKRFGKVANKQTKEFGKKLITITRKGRLFKGLNPKEQVWMSHGDQIFEMPEDFDVLAKTDTCPYAAMENNKLSLFGVQFHPEVIHTQKGNRILQNFVLDICKAPREFTFEGMAEKLIAEVKASVGSDAVLMGVSGGVDSTVAATIIHKAIGDRLFCVYIDTGLMRKDESLEIGSFFEQLSFRHFSIFDASNDFLRKLRGILDPEEKRKIIGHTYIRVFEKLAKKLEKEHPNIRFLGQGTIYPDRIESAQPSKYASKIKSHHNVTLPEKMKLRVIEPLKDLYKDDVRRLGRQLGIPEMLIGRHPFPGPGLAIRILGEVTKERLDILKSADAIFIEELRRFRHYHKVWQALAALLPVRAVGVMGDARTYGYIITLRAVTSVDAMTADWARLPPELLEQVSSRITNEVKGVTRVLYDVTQKPPATIEYE